MFLFFHNRKKKILFTLCLFFFIFKIHYIHAKGDERTWECVERTTTSPSSVDAVEIMAFANSKVLFFSFPSLITLF
jgi:hypothetical protein